jgi:ABC-2 type transport system ATP-binding protein
MELAMPEHCVSVEGVCREYGTLRALSDVSFELQGPGLWGLLGPNGAGKTSLLDLLAGLARPSRGRIRLFGAELAASRYPRRRVGVVLQREFAPDQLSAREYADLFAAIYGVRGGELGILRRAQLEARARVPVARLSGGEAQRLFIATALVHDPELLLLDEPTAGLDPQHKHEVGQLLRDLSQTKTLLMSTHDLAEAERLCDRCLFLAGGEIRAQGAPAELLRLAGAQDLAGAFRHFCGASRGASGDSA